MNVSKRGWKRCMAILLSLVICICFMPADAFAFIGPVVGVAEDMQIKTDITKDGWHIAQLKNDYITFEIETGQGLICRTVPTKTAGDISLKKSYDQNIFQELDFGEYDYGGTYAWTEDGRPEIIEETKQLVPDKVKVISGDGLILEYSFQNTHVKCRATFRLVEMTEGMYRGRYTAPVSVDNYYNEHGTQERGRTYVVTVEFKFYSIKQLYYDSYGTSNNYVHLKSHRLPYYGHENETNPKRILAEYGRFSAHEYLLPAGRTKFIGWEHTPQVCGLTDVTGGCTDIWTGTDKTPDWDGTGYNPKTESVDNYTNVGTLTYDEANPFVLLGDNFGHIEGDAMVNSSNEAYGIEGSLPAGAVSMTYIPPSGDGPSRDKDLLLTKSNAVFIYLNHGDMQNTYWEEDRYFAITSLVWGYRNLYKEGQTVVPMGEEAKALDSEFEAMGLNPDQLVITKSGDSYKAELNPTEEIKDAVAILSGSINYVKDGGYYAFNNGKAYLSPTVTANFDSVKDHFYVKPDGTIDCSGIRLSVPTYCLYKSKNRPKGKEPEFSYDSEKGLVIGLDPTNNEAIINVDIPYATTSIDGVSLETNGNVNFYGGVHIATIFDGARFDLTKFQMATDPDSNEFGMNGIEASLDVENVGLMGLDVNKASGYVNTIDQQYEFEVDVNAYDVVEFAGILKLKETEDNVLLPDTLEGKFSSDLVGITIIPEVPAIELNGLQLGFAGLVDTINEDYFAIPPISLTIGAHGTVAKAISGWLSTTVGPSGFSITGSDLEISPPGANTDLKLLKELSISFKDVGAQRKYNSRTYKGIDLSGNLMAKISLMNDGKKVKIGAINVDVAHILDITGQVGFSAFGGRNKSTNMAYMDVNATGNVFASLKVPGAVPVFGGDQIASANCLLKVGAQTETTYSESLEKCLGEAFKNVNGYAAVCLDSCIDTVVLGKYYLRTYYISPDNFGFNYGSGTPGEFVVDTSGTKDSATVQKLPVLDKDGKQAGEILFGLALKEKDINVTAEKEADGAKAASNTLKVSLADGVELGPDDSVMLLVVPTESVSEEAFMSDLKIDGKPALKIELDENGVSTNLGNVKPTVVEGKVISAALFLDPSKDQWVITSGTPLEEEPALYISNEDLIEDLEGVTFSGNALTGSVANLQENTSYKLLTYMCGDKDSDGVLVGEPLTISEGSFQVDVPNNGDAAETGDYYISTTLVQVQTEDFDGDGTISEDETVEIPLTRWVSEETMHYINTSAPEIPSNIDVEATGNETLTCSFREVEDAEGYRIRIYKDGEDTGYGYELPVVVETDPETGDTVKTLDTKGSSQAVTYEDGVFSVCMAPTVSAEARAEGVEQQEALEPGEGYSVGVAAYTYLDEETKEFPVYSLDAMSADETISIYEKAKISVKLNGKEIAQNENGIYEGTVSQDSRNLKVEVTSGGDYMIEVTAEDTEEAEAIKANGASLNSELPDFEGSVMYDIVVTNKSTQDRTTAFLKVDSDETPPVLMMDAESFMSDAEGKTVITGTTDPGATVNGVKADGEGRFEIVDIYDEHYAIVRETSAKYVAVNREEVKLTDISEFINLKDEEDVEVEPSEWEGPGTYTKITRNIVTEYCSVARYDELKEGVEKGEVEGLSDLIISEKEMGEEEAMNLSEEDYRTVTLVSRATRGFARDYSVIAEDESGNTTEATVKIAPHVHSTKKVAGKAATCCKEGKKTHYVCTVCGQKFLDKYGETKVDSLTIPKDPNKHNYGSWKTTKKATVFKKGLKKRTCKDCGHVDSKAIAKLKATLSLGVGKVKVSKTTVPMKMGQTFKKITATMKNGDSLKTAKSANKKIVTVKISKNKLVLKAGKKAGKAKITVKTKAGATSTFTIRVQKGKVTATSIKGFKKTLTLKKGKTYQMPKDVVPVTVTDKITFKSSKPKVVSVTKGGKLKALKKGKSVITVTIGKKKFKCTVTVK